MYTDNQNSTVVYSSICIISHLYSYLSAFVSGDERRKNKTVAGPEGQTDRLRSCSRLCFLG